MDENFEKTYNNFVLPKLTELEPRRKELLKKMVLKEIGLVTLFILLFIIMCKLFILGTNVFSDYASPILGTLKIFTAFFLLPAIVISIFAGIYLVPKNTINEFKKLIKSQCMKILTESTGELSWTKYKPQNHLPLQESDLFPMYTDIKYDDTFSGEYKGCKFYIQEVELILEGSKEKSKVFKGVIICTSSNKTINAQTIITAKSDLNIQNRVMTKYSMLVLGFLFISLGLSPYIFHVQINGILGTIKLIFYTLISVLIGLGCILIAYLQHKKENEYKKIALEDLNFDKRFNVLSKDQIEARYLVTTAFMDRLQNVQCTFGTKNIKCSFFGDNIMFAIATNRDIFEIGNLFIPLTDKKQVENFYDEISSVYNMIDYFKLTQKTGL